MGCRLGRNKVAKHDSVLADLSSEKHSATLRHKILHDIPLSFNEKHIVFVFGPPIFPSRNVADFISFKTGLPVVDPEAFDHFAVHLKMDNESENEGYSDEDMSHLRNQIKSLNGANGFVVYNCPRTRKQFEQLLASINCTRSTTFFLDVNKQVAEREHLLK
jgi:uncharacterized protein YecE (DUF72 family)